MSDSRERFLAYHELEFGYRPTNKDGRFVYEIDRQLLKLWQHAEAETARRCAELIEGQGAIGGHRSVMADAIRAEFPEAFE